jgi:hypothetical protein
MQALARSLVVSVLVTAPALVAAQPLTFAKTDYPSGLGARAVVTADFNRDGWPDVAHAGLATSHLSILLNTHGEGFAPAASVPIGIGAFDLTTGDFNRDAIPDLAVANADSNTLSILLGRGDGRFTRTDITTGASPRGITTGDFNKDGKPDLAYTAYLGAAVEILLGDGAGGFAVRWGLGYAAHPQGIVSADFTRDGQPDFAVAYNAPEGLIVWRGPAGRYLPTVVPGASYLNVLATADLNGDGWMDVAAASTTRGRVAIYLGAASGLVFARSYGVDGDPRGVTIADVNGDGVLDVVTANRATSTVTVLPGDPAQRGSFLPRRTFAAGLNSRTIAAADFNADGLPDLVTGNQYAAAVSVLSNGTPLLRAGSSFGRLTLPVGVELVRWSYENQGRMLSAGDFNHDGKVDVVGRLADQDTIAVILTGGNTVILPGPFGGHVVDDFNDDGNPDVLGYGAGQLITYLGNGRGGFSTPLVSPYDVNSCVPGDMNRDARLDLVCAGQIMLGDGSGTFTRGAAFPTAATRIGAVADLNRDGKLDVIALSGPSDIWFGDGGGRLTLGATLDVQGHLADVADLNRDGYPDLVIEAGETLEVKLGSAAGYQEPGVVYFVGDEMGGDVVLADINLDGNPDIVSNPRGEDAGLIWVMAGLGDGTFTGRDTATGRERFALVPETEMPPPRPGSDGGVPGEFLVADINGDGVPDVITPASGALVVLLGQRNETNHPPSAPDYAVTAASLCARLSANASDADQHALFVEWFDADGVQLRWGLASYTFLDVCVERPGTYHLTRIVSDGRGGVASGTVTLTVTVAKEIVLHAADNRAGVAGGWTRVPDTSAAGGARVYYPEAGLPKVPMPTLDDFVVLTFSADPTLTYKLWVRLKADSDSWANDSVWISFANWTGGGATDVGGDPISALPINLEECVNCGVSGWGWEDDGWGAVNKNGTLLRFPSGGWQQVLIQRREDGASVDQIVLSAEKYLATRPGAAKKDTTILPATQ